MLEMPENLAINNGGGGDDSPKFRKKVYQVRSSSISTFKQDKQNAEEIYRMLFDKRTKQISEQGQKICEQHGIDEESLVPLKLSYFESQDGDKDMAKLHYRHY